MGQWTASSAAETLLTLLVSKISRTTVNRQQTWVSSQQAEAKSHTQTYLKHRGEFKVHAAFKFLHFFLFQYFVCLTTKDITVSNFSLVMFVSRYALPRGRCMNFLPDGITRLSFLVFAVYGFLLQSNYASVVCETLELCFTLNFSYVDLIWHRW